MHSLDEKCIAKALKELRERIALAAKQRSNKQEILDYFEHFRTGLSDLIGCDLSQGTESDVALRPYSVAGSLAESPATVVTLVWPHQKLANGADRTHENYMAYVSTLTTDTLLGEIHPTLQRYSVNEPSTYYEFLDLWMQMLEVLFPACCGYEVVRGWRRVNRGDLAYGQVIKRSTGSAEGKVLLIVLPRREARHIGDVADWEATTEYHLWLLAEQLFDEQLTYYPDRIFWFGFRGVHLGCGWQYKGWYPGRFWPAERGPYQDVRIGTTVDALRCMVQLMCDGGLVTRDALLQRSDRMLRQLM